jgi:hypothetical protein
MWTRRTAPLAFVLILAGVGGCMMGSGMWVIDWFAFGRDRVTIEQCDLLGEDPDPGLYCNRPTSPDDRPPVVGADLSDVGHEVEVVRTAFAPGYDEGTYLFAPSRDDLIVPGLAAVPVLIGLFWLGFIIARAIRDDPDVT